MDFWDTGEKNLYILEELVILCYIDGAWCAGEAPGFPSVFHQFSMSFP